MKNISEQAMLKNKVKSARFGCANGGMAKRQGQGLIHGPGTGTSDSVPIDLPSGAKIAASKGEFIVPSDTTAKLGAHNLQAMVDATHTPVPQKNRFDYVNGGGLYSQVSDELRRGRAGDDIHPYGARGSGPLTASDVSAANLSPQIQQSGIASRTYANLAPITDITALAGQSAGTGNSVPNTTDMSLALPKTAVPGITPIAQYGGMDNTAGKAAPTLGGQPITLDTPLPYRPASSPTNSGQAAPLQAVVAPKKQVSQLAIDALHAPIQGIQRLHNDYTSFGYANGGRVGAVEQGRVLPEVSGDAITPALAQTAEVSSKALAALGKPGFAAHPAVREALVSSGAINSPWPYVRQAARSQLVPSMAQFMPVAAGITGAIESLAQPKEAREAFIDSVGAEGPVGRSGADAARVLSNVGNAGTGGGASIIGHGISTAVDYTKRKFGYANGGRVRMQHGGQPPVYPVDEMNLSSDEWDLLKRNQKTVQQLRQATSGKPGPYPTTQGYSVSELPMEEINLGTPRQPTAAESRLANNPALRDPAVQKRIAQANTRFNVGQAADAVKGAASDAVEGVKDAAGKVKGFFGKAKGITDITPSKIGGALKLGLAAAPAFGAFDAMTESPEEVEKFNAITPGPQPVKTALRYLQHIGNAATLGVAGMAGRGLAGLSDDNDPGGNAVREFWGENTPAKNAAMSKVPSPSFGALSTPNLSADRGLIEMGVPASAQNRSPVDPEQRGAFVRGEVGNSIDRTQYQNLGDYGAPGTQIFGRSTNGSAKLNDFVGIGGGHPVPNNGVTLGIKPGDLEAYQAGAAGAQFGGLRPPEYYVSPETTKLHGLMGPMAERLAAMRPGDPGRKRLTAQLEALNVAASGLQSADTLQNAHAMASFGHAAGMQQHLMSMNNNLALKRGELGLGQARLDQEWAVKEAERTNAQREFAYQHGEDAVKKNDTLAQDYAATKYPGDEPKQKQYAGILKMLMTTRGYEDPNDLDKNGKPKVKSFHELNKHSRGLLMGDIAKLADYNLERLSTGKPMDPMGQGADQPAGLGETIRYGVRHAEPGLIPRQIFYGTRRAPDGTIIKNPDLTTSYSQ